MENKILTYDSVEISFDGEAVVHDVSFSLTPGEIVGENFISIEIGRAHV